jgi:hypothetical protein
MLGYFACVLRATFAVADPNNIAVTLGCRDVCGEFRNRMQLCFDLLHIVTHQSHASRGAAKLPITYTLLY